MSKSLALWSAVRKFFTRTNGAGAVSKKNYTGYDLKNRSCDPVGELKVFNYST